MQSSKWQLCDVTCTHKKADATEYCFHSVAIDYQSGLCAPFSGGRQSPTVRFNSQIFDKTLVSYSTWDYTKNTQIGMMLTFHFKISARN